MTEYDDHGRARINVDFSGAVARLRMVSERMDVLAAAGVKAFRNAETQSILSGLNSDQINEARKLAESTAMTMSEALFAVQRKHQSAANRAAMGAGFNLLSKGANITTAEMSAIYETLTQPDWGHDPMGLMFKCRLANNEYLTWAEMLRGFANWIEELSIERAD